MTENVRKRIRLATALCLLGMTHLFACTSRNDRAETAQREGVFQVVQAKGLGGFDGYREMALINEFFLGHALKDAGNSAAAVLPDQARAGAPELYRCPYVSHIRVRTEDQLYSDVERRKRFDHHVRNARLAVSQKRLRERVLRELSIADADQLTLRQAKFLSDVHPVSETFLQEHLIQALGDASSQECLAQQKKVNAKETVEEDAATHGIRAATCALGSGLGTGLVALIAAGGAIELTGVAIIYGLFAAGTGVGGIILGGMATAATAGSAVKYIQGSRQFADSERIARSVQELQKLQGEAFKKAAANEDFEVYAPRFTLDDLDIELADENLTLAELKKDPNVQKMQRLSVDHMHRILEDALVEAHVHTARQMGERKGAGVFPVLESRDCAADTRLLLVSNDVEFFDKVKEAGFEFY